MNSEIENKILNKLQSVFENSEIKIDDLLLEGGIIDSFGVIQIVEIIEVDFGIVMTNEDLTAENLKSVRAIAALVAKKSQ